MDSEERGDTTTENLSQDEKSEPQFLRGRVIEPDALPVPSESDAAHDQLHRGLVFQTLILEMRSSLSAAYLEVGTDF
jgi:hypothetical protein